ncbi:host attachment protein [Reyranella sp.]|uniref:host attachment protein n=1 Tax=Reyranella sp. TaxID=1929291 RepID=UPI003D1271CE
MARAVLRAERGVAHARSERADRNDGGRSASSGARLGDRQAGARLASANSDARHAFEPPHDIHKMQKHDFTARLAAVLDKACGEGQFDRLVLVAPPRSLGELRSLLSARVKKAVSHEVGKDLTNATPTELREVLADMLPRAALV